MKKAHWLLKILVLGLLAVLLVIPSSSKAGAPFGGSLVISEASEYEKSPSVAYNSQRQEYLVVWYNDRPGCDDIRAQRVGKNGALISHPFYISGGCPGERRYPDVAYNSYNDQYLVGWEHYDPSEGSSIRVRRISGDGTLIDGSDIIVRDAGYNLFTPVKPAVSFASTPTKYLVVWAETWHPMPITYEILGQVVGIGGALEGSRFTISSGTNELAEPDVAYNHNANRYLVVWQLDAGALYDIHGQQVHGGGGLYQGDITIAYWTKSSTAPAVAAIPTSPTDEKFLVVWEFHDTPNNRDIYGLLIKEDGTIGSDIFISYTPYDESSPALATSDRSLKLFVTWCEHRGIMDNAIVGREISYTGIGVGEAVEFSGVAADYPAVAAGPKTDYLVVWQDQFMASTSTNLYGQLFGNRAYLPVVYNHP